MSRASALEDQLNERLDQLSMEQSLVHEQLNHLDENEARRTVVESVRSSFAGVPLVVEGNLDDGNGDLVLSANAGIATLTSTYSRSIHTLQRGAVFKMVLERGECVGDSSRSSCGKLINERQVEQLHTVVDVEVKVTNQLRSLEWSIVGSKPHKRFAIGLTDISAIMCGGKQEARRMGGLCESTLFRLHLRGSAVNGRGNNVESRSSVAGAGAGNEPQPLQFAAASRQQRHEWAVGLALLHSFCAMSKQIPVLFA
jgi:hypothetical protein